MSLKKPKCKFPLFTEHVNVQTIKIWNRECREIKQLQFHIYQTSFIN